MAYVAQKGEGGGRITGKLNDTVIRRPIRGGSGGVTRGVYTGSRPANGGGSSGKSANGGGSGRVAKVVYAGSTKTGSKGGGVVRKVASKTDSGSAFYSKVSK